MKHLGGTNAVQHFQATGLFPQLACGIGQALASADTQAQAGYFAGLDVRGHLPVKRGCGVANGATHLGHHIDHGRRRVGLVVEVHRTTGPHRKHQQTAQTKGEGQWGRAHHDVFRGGAQHMAWPGLASAQDIAVAVGCGFGCAGGARGEGQHGDVIGMGRASTEVAIMGRSAHRQRPRCIHQVEWHDRVQHRLLLLGQFQLMQQRGVAQSHAGLGFGDDLAQLLGAQQGHGGHSHQAGLDHTHPGQSQADGIATAQQHPVARHQTQVVHQHLGNAVDAFTRFAVTQGDARRAQHRAIAPALFIGPVQQFTDQVELIGECQLRQVAQHLRMQPSRGQAFADKPVDVCAHVDTPLRTDLPMMSNCTSLAPS